MLSYAIVIDYAGEPIGIRVDSVSESINIEKSDINPPPPLIQQRIGEDYIKGVTKINKDTLITLLNVDFLLDLK